MNRRVITKSIDFQGKTLEFQHGQVAFQATNSVVVSYGETVVLVTVVMGKFDESIDYFPLSIAYEERLYANGVVKSSRFEKRDGKSSDASIIRRRQVDHAIRPLFPKDFKNEVQIALTVLAYDPTVDLEFVLMTAASVVMTSSKIPFYGPMVSGRVGLVNGEYILNPSEYQLESSELDMMISFSGEDKKFLAIEAGANNLSNEKILAGIEFVRNSIDPVLSLILDFSKELNPSNEKVEYVKNELPKEAFVKVNEAAQALIADSLRKGFDKDALKVEQDKILDQMVSKFDGVYEKDLLSKILEEIQTLEMRKMILREHKRPDGRGIFDLRPLESAVGILPRVHGSGIFTRGLTQVLTVATLGAPSEELLLHDMFGERSKRFMHFYNFPPYSSGETGRFGGPGSREIGHGMIAEKALKPVIPSQKDFPYTIVLVSETLSSSGSTSMAATCGSSLALMDAGVPIKHMVGGIGVGLIVDEDLKEYLIINDIAYMEDASGFMDFKVAGTRTGITAIQCDMKLPGIPFDLLPKILDQSFDARQKVLDNMEIAIKTSRTELKPTAPKMTSIKIDPDKIGVVIGSGGKTIKEIEAKTGATLSIEEDGNVIIFAKDTKGAEEAKSIVNGLTKKIEIGEVYTGPVVSVVDFGAFVEILPGVEALLHVSEISNGFVKNVSDFIKEGDVVTVKVIKSEPNGKIGVSKKALEEKN